MKKHTKIYLEAFGIGYDANGPTEYIPCEMMCGRAAVDVHHIFSRGMGGTKAIDKIINLMGLCRQCHVKYGDIKSWIPTLQTIHDMHMKKRLVRNG